MMPKKKTQILFDGPDQWDILYKVEYELIPHEGRWYPFKSMIIYVSKDNHASKIRIL
jgi:hypothetical protein